MHGIGDLKSTYNLEVFTKYILRRIKISNGPVKRRKFVFLQAFLKLKVEYSEQLYMYSLVMGNYF